MASTIPDLSPPQLQNCFQLTSTKTALALLVPPHLQTEINSLRSIYDRAYHKWQPHINILYPFVDPSQLSSAVSILRDALREQQQQQEQQEHGNTSAIKTRINSADHFKHRKNATVFLKPDPESATALCQLRRTLVTSLGLSEQDGTFDGEFKPHLTIGQAGLQGRSLAALQEKAEKIADGLEWWSGELAVLKRESTGEMRVVDTISLGSAPDSLVDSTPEQPPNTSSSWKNCFSYLPDAGWSRARGKSGQTSLDQVAGQMEAVTIISYNVMMEPDAPVFSTRFPLIIEGILRAAEASKSLIKVLCLQEVSEESLSLILSDDFIQTTFPYSTHSPVSVLPSHRNLVTLANIPFTQSVLPFPERHKSALVIKPEELAVQIANVHLTSTLNDESVRIKVRQMKLVTEFLTENEDANTAKAMFVAGDFNLTTSSSTIETALSRNIISPETKQELERVIDTDVWSDAFLEYSNHSSVEADSVDFHDGEEGATFDRRNNPLAALLSAKQTPIDDRPQRYDRVLFTKSASIQVDGFHRFGLPGADGQCGSDHYGICATLTIEEEKEASRTLPASQTATTAIGSNLPLIHLSPSAIQRIEDSTYLTPLIEPYLPRPSDQTQREAALTLLHQTLTGIDQLGDVILAPLGSYAMGTYLASSDVDVLAIGAVTQREFFEVAVARLKTQLSQGNGGGVDGENGFKAVHFVNSLVPIGALVVGGVKIDLQYCQAADLLERYHGVSPAPDLKSLALDDSVIAQLLPTSLRPLNTYRDTAYLITSLPDIESYRTAHRFLSLYLKRHGLYSAKFGYLGGIHLSLMLSRVAKLLSAAYPQNAETTSASSDERDANSVTGFSPASLVRSFFTYYSTFDWANDVVSDPFIHTPQTVQGGISITRGSGKSSRRARDPVLIQSIFTPTARPNVASSCTRLSAQTFSIEFSKAAEHVSRGEWGWCLRSQEANMPDFLAAHGAFIRIAVDLWDVDQMDAERLQNVLGGTESKIPGLMVTLARLDGVAARVWPARFCIAEDSNHSDHSRHAGDGGSDEVLCQTQYKGYYLVGVSARGGEDEDRTDAESRKMTTNKVFDASRAFGTALRESRWFEEGNMWVEVELVPRKKVQEMGLVLDEREWGAAATVTAAPATETTNSSHGGREEEHTQAAQDGSSRTNPSSHEPSSSSGNGLTAESATGATTTTTNKDKKGKRAKPPPGGRRSPSPASCSSPSSTGLRPVQDILSRIRWDAGLVEADFLIGYEDRFLGVKETELARWKTEQTDDEFIPMHRIVWVRRKGEDGEKVWDRAKKVDLIFGSGREKATT